MEKNSNIYFPVLLNSTNIIFMDENDDYKMKFIKLSSENISGDLNFNSFVRDPCNGGPRFRLDPEKKKEDEFIFLINASIYLKHYREVINNTNYCFGYIAGSHFSVIMCLKEQTENNNDNNDYEDNNNTLIKAIGMIASVPFFLATLAVYMIIPQLRNLHGWVLINYITCLFIAYLVLSITILCSYYIGDNLCTAVAFVIHFSFLASFFWLNVMCFDIWWTFGKNPGLYTNPYGGFRALQGSQKKQERKKFACYSIYAWGCAGLLTGICLIMDFHPNISSSVIRPQFGKESCWFATDAARAIYFYGPMGVTVVCNIILFIATAMKIVHHKKETAHLNRDDNRRHNDNKQWFNLYLKLFIVMGVNWSMEIISWIFGNKPDYIWYVTDVANTLQGLVIFIIFVWKRKIKILLLKRFGCKDSKFLQSRNSTRSTHNSSMSTKTNTSILNPLPDKFKMTTIERNQDENTEVF
ncbi:G-protein coupled receptor Mth2-like isoform X2 [Cotesia glomerata]|uniref:G-protein coupled receptor Mth2-like isoform X2 n=1 Tax=Cotesia glomerata TaxID=32391 RepID=UPI001D02D873|nr:G-protein coupled receptor Mth2-like isoform X2 [Cotesia glomerata]